MGVAGWFIKGNSGPTLPAVFGPVLKTTNHIIYKNKIKILVLQTNA